VVRRAPRRDAIEAFLKAFVAAGIQGELVELFTQGLPWRLTLVARFDDFANGPSGERLHENRTVLVLTTRWGRVVRQEDFYEDTGRILAFEAQGLRGQGR
jgi:hypothetical protein